jgi:hypothetical protein
MRLPIYVVPKSGSHGDGEAKLPPPSEEIDFSGYLVLVLAPETTTLLGVAGSGGIPASSGALRQYLRCR